MSSGFFRGTNTEQDSRWGDAEKKLLRRTKFSKVLEQKVNMKKVNMDVMQRWITQRITSLLGFEDDIVVGTCVNYLSEEGKLDPKKLQLQLTGFLEKSTGMFMEELWGLLIDAQHSLGGIPSAFLQEKKEEILQAKEEERKQEEELLQKLAEHQQEMEKSAPAKQTDVTTNDASSSSASANVVGVKHAEGRRASRWGQSPAVITTTTVSATPAAESTTTDVAVRAEEAAEVSTSLTSGRESVEHVLEKDTNPEPQDGGEDGRRDRSSSDRGESPARSQNHSRSRRDGRDQEGGKEKKRKSKSKHGRKSERKKRKSSRRTGDDREHRRHDRKSESSSSGDDEGDTSAMDAEEALRLKVLASVASKKDQRAQDADN